jgi:predicted enzyme related to lactoylglutathione lyase
MSLRLIRAILLLATAATTVEIVTARSAVEQASTRPIVHAGEFVWHDLVTANPAAARAFYGALFGWTFEAGQGVDPGYTIIKHETEPIGGIVLRKQQETDTAASQWLSYVVVRDVDKAARAFRDAGGRIFRGPLNARRDLRVAVVADNQGAALGLANRGPAVRNDQLPGMHRWLWMEYVAKDPAHALLFLGQVLGFGHEISETRDDFIYYLLSTDRPRAGLFRTPWDRERSVWLPYVRVEDPAAMAERVVELGGSLVLAPKPEIRNSSLAIVLDPTGAPLALQRFPFQTGATP